jgi:hypothetical protein
VILVAAVTTTGWLVLLFVLLAWAPRDKGARSLTPPGVEPPPAVVSLLAGRLRRDGFGVTLADLAARGWFRVTPPGVPGRATGWPGSGGGPTGPVMCVVPAETPDEPLAPYERRVLAHVALRAGAAGQVPAPALSDGFEGGEAAFMSAFREEVTADAIGRGLIRRRLSGWRIALLCLTLAVPAAALGISLAAHKQDTVGISSFIWFVLSVVTIGIGTSRRPNASGRVVLDRWHATADAAWRSGGAGGGWAGGGWAGGGGADGGGADGGGADGGGAGGEYRAYSGGQRLGAYAAALGRAPGVVAVFASPSGNMAWSSYRGSWQQIPIETNTWSCQAALAVFLAAICGLVLFAATLAWLVSNGLGALAVPLGQLTGLFFVAGVVAWVLRRRLFPRFAEFDGQVIRQWMVGGDDESPDQYHIAVDDGVRAKAWDLLVSSGFYDGLAPGTLVHAQVSLWRPRQATVHLVEPAAVARQLANPGAPHDPRGPAVPEVRDLGQRHGCHNDAHLTTWLPQRRG